MRFLRLVRLLLLTASVGLAQLPPGLVKPQPPVAPIKDASHLEGTVTNTAGEPMRQVSVRADAVIRQLGLQAGGFTATTDAQGKFAMDNMAPGRYTLTATRQGFIAQKYGAKTFTAPGTVLNLESQQKLTGLDIKLTPQGTIRGRVTDQDGDPIRGSLVSAVRETFDRLGRRLVDTAGNQTNDQGEFTVQNLAPGRYYLTAEPSGDLLSALPGYVVTYYPNGLDPSTGTMIEVGPGANVQGIEMRLRRESVYSIKGKVVDTSTGALAPGAMFDWTVKGARNVPTDRRIWRTRDDGTFTIRGLLPGSYLVEMLQGGTVGAAGLNMVLGMTGRLEVNINDADYENVVFALTPGAQLSGTVHLDDPSQDQSITLPPGLNITAVPVDGRITVPSRINNDRTFTLEKVSAGAYLLDIANLPSSVYVKAIRAASRDVTHATLDLVSGANTVEIVLSAKPADVSGSVRNSAGDPLQGISVSLWTRTPDGGSVASGAHAAVTDQTGSFRFNSLPPGAYYLLAWEEIDPGLAQYYGFLTRFNARAARLEIAEGTHEKPEPPLVSATDIAAELTRMNLTSPPMFRSNGAPATTGQNASNNYPIAGRVLDAKGEALRKATVRMTAISTFQGQTVAITGDDGRFSFEEVPAGSFELTAEKTGYLVQRLGAQKPGTATSVGPAAKLSVKPGETLRDLEIKLTPQGVISGRVTNQAGEPLTGTQVSVWSYEYQRSRRQPVGTFGVATDATGAFRIAGLTPGRYYVSAAARGLFDLAGGVTAGAAPNEGNVQTYFPSEVDLAHATVLDIEPGTELRSVDIQMRSSRVYSVRGKGALADGGPIVDQIFTLRPKERAGASILTNATATPNRDGIFEFRSVVPGTYLLQAGLTRLGNNYASPTLFGQLEVVVADSDVEGVTLALTPGITVTGTTSVENSNVRPRPTVSLSEVPDSPTGFGTIAQFRDDGTFEMRGTAPGKYILGVFNVPPGMYLKSAQSGGQDVIHSPLDLTGGPARLALVFSTRVGRLDGAVKNAAGQPVGNVMVSLWPRTPEAGMTNGSARFTSAGPKGVFEFVDLAPGNYYVAAWEDVEPALIRSSEFPDQFQMDARQVTMMEDGRVTLDVPMIPRQKIADAVAKLP